MPHISRRGFVGSWVALGAAAEVSILATGCAVADEPPVPADDGLAGMTANARDFGAFADGASNDSAALRAAYDAVLDRGGGTVELTGGRYFIPDHLEMHHPGVSLVGTDGAVVGGGEVRVGPAEYGDDIGGVDFSGDRISDIEFGNGDDFGASRCLVIRNARGLDVTRNYFSSGGKGVAVEASDGNEKFHTTSMLRISQNRFARLVFGVYADTLAWDCLSDWQIADNYFNYCSDTSVWIASTQDGGPGGIDGLDFSGNTVFSLHHNASDDPLFAVKRYNLRLGKSNWLRIVNNNFFEAGLSAVYLEGAQNFTIVGNHMAWPGQRELADGVEIHGGRPAGVITGNTFSQWTRAAIGFYDTSDLTHVEIGQNDWNWTPSPTSWTGEGALSGYRVHVSGDGHGLPIVRDFSPSGAHDEMRGETALAARDVKSPKGGVTGAFRRTVEVAGTVGVFRLADITNASPFGGLISVTATNSTNEWLIATYLLFVSSQGSVCTVLGSGGNIDGTDDRQPSFTWALSDNVLEATPVGLTSGTFDFDGVSVGAVSMH